MKRLLVVIGLFFCVCGAMLAQDETANPVPFSYSADLSDRAQAGDMTAQFRLGYCYYMGGKTTICPDNPWMGDAKRTEAHKHLSSAAAQGHVYADFLVGCYYYYGYAPVKKDYDEARKIFERAAKKGCTDAMVNLGIMYDQGLGVAANRHKVLEYTQRAAEGGNASAQYNMSVLIKTVNKRKSVEWLEKSAAQNYVKALRDLGVVLMQGDGVDADPVRAVSITRKAIKQGSSLALHDLGVYYYHGMGVEQDRDMAAIYYYRAYKSGEQNGLNGLKSCYEVGALDAAVYDSYQDWLRSLSGYEKNYERQEKQSQASQGGKAKESSTPLSDVDVNIPASSASNDNTFAVIIANENYQEEVKVDFALNDGEAFRQYCQRLLGLPETNVHIRKDATLNNIKAEMAWMQQVAKAYKGQARFIVYYAGHGVPDEKSGTAYLLPVDGKGTMLETGYSLAGFYQQLSELNADRVTVFMDACFSGSKRGEGMLASARGIAIKSKPQAPKGKMVVFTAAQGDETAYPFKEKGHGLFTYYLLKKLKDTKGDVSYDELGRYITDEVGRKSIVANGKSQTPTVVPSAAVADSWQKLKLK